MRLDDLDRLYSDHAEALYGFLAYRVGDAATAEDLLADTFERALRAHRRFDRRRASEKTWLYAIALNVLRDQLRSTGAERRAVERLRHERSAPVDLPGPGMVVEQRDELRVAIAMLAPEEQEAIALRFGAGLSVPELARVTGTKLTTAEGRLYRSLRKLRETLDAPD